MSDPLPVDQGYTTTFSSAVLNRYQAETYILTIHAPIETNPIIPPARGVRK